MEREVWKLMLGIMKMNYGLFQNSSKVTENPKSLSRSGVVYILYLSFIIGAIFKNFNLISIQDYNPPPSMLQSYHTGHFFAWSNMNNIKVCKRAGYVFQCLTTHYTP